MTQYHRKPEYDIRTIPLDIDVYTTCLIAADRLPLDLVRRVRECIGAGYELWSRTPRARRRWLPAPVPRRDRGAHPPQLGNVRALRVLRRRAGFDGGRSLAGHDRLHGFHTRSDQPGLLAGAVERIAA